MAEMYGNKLAASSNRIENTEPKMYSTEDQKVLVAVRVRPKLDKPSERYQVECIQKVNDGEDKTIVVAQNEGKDNKFNSFSFDRVYDQESTQLEFYQESCLELVDSALQGFDVTIFTYGQTGSGKTWTVLGKVGNVRSGEDIITEDSGLFLRILSDLFRFKSQSTTMDVQISVSILEIYLEEFRDLLADSKDRGKIVTLREIDNDVQMQNLTTDRVDSIEEVYKLYKYAEKNRMVSATNMNDVSSRSHCTFLLDIEQTEKDSNTKIKSRICLVDLAGSERVKKSEVEGIHMKEAQSINKSLSALGNVVNGLFLDKKHIPFRDSKLTRILKPSFVGKGKVLLIANLSPTQASCMESLSTLRFANRVKEMKAPSIQDDGIERQKESELLELMRQNERLYSYHNIATKVFGYEPQLSDFSYRDNYIVALEAQIKEVPKGYSDIMKKKEELRKVQRDRQLQEEIAKLTREKAEEWQERVKGASQRLDDRKKKLEHEKQQARQRVDKLKEELNSKKETFVDLQREHSLKQDNLVELREEVSELHSKKERLENEVKQSHVKYQAQIEDYEKNWRKEEESMQSETQNHELVKKLHSMTMSLRSDQLKYLHLKQTLHNSQKNRDMILKRLVQHEIRVHLRDTVLKLADDAIDIAKVIPASLVPKRTMEPKIQSNSHIFNSPTSKLTPTLVDIIPEQKHFIPSTNEEIFEVLKKSYPYDRKNILAMVVDYLKSGSILTLHSRGRKSRRFFFAVSEDLQSLLWKDENYAAMESVTVYTLPLFSIQSIVLGQYSETFRTSLLTKEDDFYYSFSLEHSSQRTVDLSATNCFDFEAWVLALSAILGLKPQWGGMMQHVGKKEAVDLLTESELELCSSNHIDVEAFLFIRNLINELRENNMVDLTRGQMRVLSQLDVIRSDKLMSFFYPDQQST